MRIISESEFRLRLESALRSREEVDECGVVTGPGRSGAVASVYASHFLGIPFIPYKTRAPKGLGRLLIIDTATETGATLRKAERLYKDADPLALAIFREPPRVAFWYEATKPQRYRHEVRP